MERTIRTKQERMRQALMNPWAVSRELNNRSLYHFIQCFWAEYTDTPFQPNWHIEILCKELEELAVRVSERKVKEHDLIINVPPGTSKTVVCSIMFPIWCWTRWHWMRFITSSYSADLSLESAEYSRDIIRSEKFKTLYPDIAIKQDKDVKSNFRVVKLVPNPGRAPRQLHGGGRVSTSTKGTITGFHADILIIDDPIDPKGSRSKAEIEEANRYLDQTISTRKTDKAVTPMVMIMQRLSQDDPTAHMLEKRKDNVRHICLPGEILNYKDQVSPPELVQYYRDGLLDTIRMNWDVLKDLEADLGQYGYAGQIGQNPVPPKGGMFQVDNFQIVQQRPAESNYLRRIRYWDKAGSAGKGAFTVGVLIGELRGGRWIVENVIRGQWASNERERIILNTAHQDGHDVEVYVEQEPGSGGKESAENTIRNLAGYVCRADRPTGDKALRADPFSVQVNNGNVLLLAGEWNTAYLDEFRFFPNSKFKDQVDASSAGFNMLRMYKRVMIFNNN